jgi:hypothetical protein
MADGLAVQMLAQGVHWPGEDGSLHQIEAMHADDCHRALDLIDLQDEHALERELVDLLLHLLASEHDVSADCAAAMCVLRLICDVGPGWLQRTRLVEALQDRSLADLFATVPRAGA